MRERLQSLDDIEAALWRELARAPQDKHHAWRTPVLATASEGLPDARTVVLRQGDRSQRSLVLYSDARAAKVTQLQRQPQAVLVCWSAALSWQLRIALRIHAHTEGEAVETVWASLRETAAAADYLSMDAPGTPIGTVRGRGAQNHFALLVGQVQAIDWLELSREGHRRACFDAQGARWLQP